MGIRIRNRLITALTKQYVLLYYILYVDYMMYYTYANKARVCLLAVTGCLWEKMIEQISSKQIHTEKGHSMKGQKQHTQTYIYIPL